MWRSQEAYIGDGQAKDAFAVVVERGQLLAVLQLLLDPPHLIGDLVCSSNIHVGGEASYYQLWAKEQGVRGLCGPTHAHTHPGSWRSLGISMSQF